MKTMKKCWIAILACLIILTSVLPANAFAAEAIDVNKDVSLTIRYEHDSKGVEGAKFSLYKIATADAYGRYKLTGDFASYAVSIEGLDQTGWNQLAQTLTGYAQRDRLPSVNSGITDTDGLLCFPTGGKSLKPGLYLLVGEPLSSGGYVYTAKPSVVALPMITENNTWNYDLTVKPKYEREESHDISRKVLKIWDDEGFETVRPSEVVVQLLKNGDVYDMVTLNRENNWRHEWDGLDNRYAWTVVEKEVENYTVNVELKGSTFTVTNTYYVPVISVDPPVTKRIVGNTPTSASSFVFVMKANKAEYPMPSGSNNGIKEITVIGTGTSEFGTINFTEPGVYEYTIYEKNTGAAGYTYDNSVFTITFTVTKENGKLHVEQSLKKSDGTKPTAILFTNNYSNNNYTPGNKLPQTGLLWWPVSVLTVAGLLMILLGFARRRNADNEE